MSQVEMPDQVWPSRNEGAGLSWPNPNVAAAIDAFVDRGPFGVAVFDPELRFILVSQGLATLHGQEASETVGKRIDEVVPAPYGELVAHHLRQALESDTPLLDVQTWGTFAEPTAARSFTSSFYRLATSSGTPLGVVVLITETTELRHATKASRSAEAQLELLRQVTDALSEGNDVLDVTEAALAGAASAVGASAAMVMTLSEPDDVLVHLASTGLADATFDHLREPARLEAPLPHSDTLRSRTITLWGSRVERDLEYPNLAEYRTENQAWAFVPLLAKDRGLGVVIFAWPRNRSFRETDIALLAAVGRQCALALEQARVLDAEREARRATEFLVEVTRFVVEGSDAGVMAISNGQRILTFNHRFCEVMGLDEGSIKLGGDSTDLLAPCLALVSDPDFVAQHLAASRDQPSESLAADFKLRDGRVLASKSSPIVDRRLNVLGRVWYVRDETEQRTQEAEQRLALNDLLASHEHQSFLLQASEIIAHANGYGEALERLAAVAVPMLADICLVDGLTLDGGVVRMAATHADPMLQPLVDELAWKYPPDPDGAHPSVEVMRTGRARWSDKMTDDFLRRTTRDDDHFALLKRLGFTSYMTLPLVADKQILGSITLVSAGSGRRFGSGDLALAEDFTSSVAQVVAAAHRNDADRQAARTLQASLLPARIPDVLGFVLAVRYLPATAGNHVGGDFYDVIAGGLGDVTIAIGDVAGHDMQAAAIMGKVRTAARVLACQSTGPGQFIDMLRQGWHNLELDRMATMLIAGIDRHDGHLRIASAGHPPPLLVMDGRARFLDVKPTTPLGAPPSTIEDWRGCLPIGATLLVFTDGLVEDRHRTFHEGAERLIRAASGHFDPAELCDRVLEMLIADRSNHDDDIAMLAVRRDTVATT